MMGRPGVALPLLEGLARQIDELRLDRWEDPALCARVVASLYRCLRGKDDERARAIYERLCQLDIGQALEPRRRTPTPDRRRNPVEPVDPRFPRRSGEKGTTAPDPADPILLASQRTWPVNPKSAAWAGRGRPPRAGHITAAIGPRGTRSRAPGRPTGRAG